MKYLSMDEVMSFLQDKPTYLTDLTLELRDLILSIAPKATEIIIWDALCYYKEKEGGPVKANVCMIVFRKDRLCLDFVHGIWLPDPSSLLKGNQKSKRYLPIPHLKNPFRWQIERLILASSQFNITRAYRGAER
jgi:hypothetical protein